jgi:hypothetical protein
MIQDWNPFWFLLFLCFLSIRFTPYTSKISSNEFKQKNVLGGANCVHTFAVGMVESQVLPIDIYREIFSHIALSKLIKYERVNRTWKAMVETEYTYRHDRYAQSIKLGLRSRFLQYLAQRLDVFDTYSASRVFEKKSNLLEWTRQWAQTEKWCGRMNSYTDYEFFWVCPESHLIHSIHLNRGPSFEKLCAGSNHQLIYDSKDLATESVRFNSLRELFNITFRMRTSDICRNDYNTKCTQFKCGTCCTDVKCHSHSTSRYNEVQ